MYSVNNYLNPFSNDFQQSLREYQSLPLVKKAAAVAAAIFGALATPYLLCLGGFVAFQLAVKWLKSSRDAVRSADENTETRSKFSQTRDNKITELRRMLHMSHEERQEEAIEKGFRMITRDQQSAGFSGKGYIENIGLTFQGNFENGICDGKFVIYQTDRDYKCRMVEQGRMEEGVMTGIWLIVNDEYWYEGRLKNTIFHGKGTFRDERKDMTVSGNFYHGKIKGKTKITLCSGDHFEGEISKHNPNQMNNITGRGKLTSRSGSIFHGPITINTRYSPEGLVLTFTGIGTLTHQDGTVEVGQVENWRIVN